MPRAASGVYSLPALNPVVSATAISSTWANNTMADVAVALTNSLDRNGTGGMLAVFKFFDGTEGVPGAAFTNEQTSGLYRAGTGDLRFSILSNDKLRITSTGLFLRNIADDAWLPVVATAAGTADQTLAWDDSLPTPAWVPNSILKVDVSTSAVLVSSGAGGAALNASTGDLTLTTTGTGDIIATTGPSSLILYGGTDRIRIGTVDGNIEIVTAGPGDIFVSTGPSSLTLDGGTDVIRAETVDANITLTTTGTGGIIATTGPSSLTLDGGTDRIQALTVDANIELTVVGTGDIVAATAAATLSLDGGTNAITASTTDAPINITAAGTGVITAGVDGIKIASSGQVGINTVPDTIFPFSSRLAIKGVAADLNILSLASSAGNSVFQAREGGQLFSTTTYSNTTAATTRALVISAFGEIKASTSVRASKKDIIDYPATIDSVMQMRPVLYRGIEQPADAQVTAGFIAEEFHDSGLGAFVSYTPDGTPDGIDYGRITAALAAAVQAIVRRLDA